MPRLEPHDVAFFASPEELRAWLLANHETATERWVGFRPKASGLPTITWHQLVDEVLCVGWIDSVHMPVDGGPARVIGYVYGGQGTINVPSWSPDGRTVAFVSNTAEY